MSHSWMLYLRTGDYCQAGCKSCPAGRKQEEDETVGGLMTAEFLKRAFDRILQEAPIRGVVYHQLNEPLLNPEIGQLVRLGKEHAKSVCYMSTNMSVAPRMFPRLFECIDAGLDNLIISTSGFTQAIHQRSHKNTDIELIKTRMIALAAHRPKARFVRVGWHNYNYNGHERPLMKKFAEDLGFTFTAYDTSLLPVERYLESAATGKEHPGEADLITKVKEAYPLCLERKNWRCRLQEWYLSFDSNGDLHECAAGRWAQNVNANLFTVDSLEAYNTRRFSSNVCNACKALGGHIYANMQYRVPMWQTPIVSAQELYQRADLGHRFPAISRALNYLLYTRPNK